MSQQCIPGSSLPPRKWPGERFGSVERKTSGCILIDVCVCEKLLAHVMNLFFFVGRKRARIARAREEVVG